MKINKLFVSALAALTLFSCSKEANIEAPIPAGQKATLKLAVTGNGSKTKATGATTTDAAVNNLTVFVFRGDGSLDVAPIYIATPLPHLQGGASTADSIIVTTAATEVYIVANTGALATSPVSGVANKASLQAKVGDLANGAASTQTATNLWMEGNGTITWGTGGTTGSVTAPLNFVGAKVEVQLDLTQFTNPTGVNQIDIDQVVLLFAGKDGKFFETPANKAIQTDFYSGDVSYANPTFAIEKTFLAENVAFAGGESGAMTTVNPHFYTFANNAATQATILALRGTRTEGADTKTYYWPVQFTMADAGHTILPGHSYTVKITLKGDTTNGGTGGGTEDPEQEIITASVEVLVTAAAWTVVPVIEKEFN